MTRFYATAGAGFEQQDPWGSYDEGAWCYGLTPECFIKLEPDEAFVKEIWFCLAGPDADQALAMRRAMQTIDRLVPSLIADYVIDACGPIGDEGFLDGYLALLARD